MNGEPLIVLINREGGAASSAGPNLLDTVSAAFAKAGALVDIHTLPGRELHVAMERAAASHRRVVVAGGDGTIASAAQVLAGTQVELAVLPLGTLNHFARDLGIPTILDDAANLAVNGSSSPVDLGKVNERLFINNASVGLYPTMVRDRDRIRHRLHLPKWLASVPASWGTLSQMRHHRMRIDMGDGVAPIVTPLLFVGNNRYSLERGAVGCRDSLSDGTLAVYAVSHMTRLSLLWFGVRATLGLADHAQDFEIVGDCQKMSVRSSGSTIEIGLDGEVQQMSLPLTFSIQVGALNVVAPRTAPVT